MEPKFSHLIPDHAMHNPNHQGLKWALMSSLASAALLAGAGMANVPYVTAHSRALLWGSLGIGSIGYLLGADIARAENRTTNMARTYERLEANGLLVSNALPAANERQRVHQSLWVEGVKSAVIQGAGSAALAIGVEAAISPLHRPLQEPAREWAPVGAIQGMVSGILSARAHNKRADLINSYEAKAAQNSSFTATEESRRETKTETLERL